MLRHKYAILASAALLTMTPLLAQSGSSAPRTKEDYERDAARSNAQKAAYDAQAAAAAARFAPLRSLAGDGTVTRGDGAGAMEAAYLSAAATQAAAALIDGSVANRAPRREILLLVDNETLSLAALAAFRAETMGIQEAFGNALGGHNAACPTESPPVRVSDTAPVVGPIAIAGAVGSLLQTTTTIQGVGDLHDHQMLAAAIAETRPGTYVLPAAMLDPQAPRTNEVRVMRERLLGCRALAAAAADALAGNNAAGPKARRAALQAAIGRYDTYWAAITTSDEHGAVRMTNIMGQSLILASNRPVLRVSMRRGGGSLITRRNIFTALGFPAITISGGVVVTYSLTEPRTGASIASGFFVCASGMTDIRAAQRLREVSPLCRPDRAASTRSAQASATARTATADGAGGAQMVAPIERPSGPMNFESVLDLRQRSAGSTIQLRHGIIADSAEWPASLYATFDTPEGRAACTAALVGPRAILTAAHCVPGSGEISIGFGTRTFSAACETNPAYQGDDSADFALCAIPEATPIPFPAGFRFESISLADISGFGPDNARVLLTGFGCRSDRVDDDRIDRLYRIGFNRIVETSLSSSRSRGEDYYAGLQNNNLFTDEDSELANLCPGDSGGPAFQTAGSGNAFGRRSIIGVNSRVFYLNPEHTLYGASLISATGGPDFKSWAVRWATPHEGRPIAVCGVAHWTGVSCRS